MSPTPDERRASWVEPGLAKRLEDGEVKSVAIDLNRAHFYSGNGISLAHGPVVTGRQATGVPHLVLTAEAIRRLARIVDRPSPQGEGHEEYDPLPERPDPFERTMPLPSPRGEDDEAGLPSVKMQIAMLRRTASEPGMGWLNRVADRLSRCPSPERDPRAEE